MKSLRLKMVGLLGTGLVVLQVVGCTSLQQITDCLTGVLSTLTGMLPTA